MKISPKIAALVLFLLSKCPAIAQSGEVSFLLDTCMTIMKANAVNRRDVDWPALENQVWNKAYGLSDPYQLGPVFRLLFQSINDFHGIFYYKDSTYHWQHRPLVISDSVMTEWQKGVHISTGRMTNNIGYLRVPSMSYSGWEDANKKAQSLNDSLCSLLEAGVKGLILDLRLDGGGAMYPMILGVCQLLPEGKIGSFTSEGGSNWYIKNDQFFIDTMAVTRLVPKCRINARGIPVAILIGPGTGSSGEFFVMALVAHADRVTIGSSTAGYVTAVRGFEINQAAQLNLSTGYGADITGKIYKEAISPDIHVTGTESFNDLTNDPCVIQAIQWLRSKLAGGQGHQAGRIFKSAGDE
jgi:hypothetical protein